MSVLFSSKYRIIHLRKIHIPLFENFFTILSIYFYNKNFTVNRAFDRWNIAICSVSMVIKQVTIAVMQPAQTRLSIIVIN